MLHQQGVEGYTLYLAASLKSIAGKPVQGCDCDCD